MRRQNSSSLQDVVYDVASQANMHLNMVRQLLSPAAVLINVCLCNLRVLMMACVLKARSLSSKMTSDAKTCLLPAVSKWLYGFYFVSVMLSCCPLDLLQ